MDDDDEFSPISSQSQGSGEKRLNLYESIYCWLNDLNVDNISTNEDKELVLDALNKQIAEVSLSVYPLCNSTFEKYESAAFLLNQLLRIKKSLDTVLPNPNTENDDSGIAIGEHYTSPFIEDDDEVLCIEDCLSYLDRKSTEQKWTIGSLLELFGLSALKDQQSQVVEGALAKKDILVVMPTGGGKSVCFLLPGLLEYGVTFVISPLKALMLDQVNYLKDLGINATLACVESDENSVEFFSSLTKHATDVKFVFITPEKLIKALSDCGDQNKLRNVLKVLHCKNLLLRFVVDEAHCIATWGAEFREEYGQLGLMRVTFPNVPIIALTGTANPKTQLKIVSSLQLINPMLSITSCVRGNLRLQLIEKSTHDDNLKKIVDMIRNDHSTDCGIIYCFSRKECEAVANHLTAFGFRASAYHAGFSDYERASTQQNWMTGVCQIMCATNAFGMGVNKRNVRFVYHLTMPSSIDEYYQECGRAGRDGSVASCVLFYQFSDHLFLQRLIDGKKLQETRDLETQALLSMLSFCENIDCRNALIACHLGEEIRTCTNSGFVCCDNCTTKSPVVRVSVSELVEWVRETISTCKNYTFTVTKLVNIFTSKPKRSTFPNDVKNSPLFAKGWNWDKRDAMTVMKRLVIDGILREEIVIFNVTLEVSKTFGKIHLGRNWPIVDYSVLLTYAFSENSNKKQRMDNNSDSDFEM